MSKGKSLKVAVPVKRRESTRGKGKRTPTQKEQDWLFISGQLSRGMAQTRIWQLLNEQRKGVYQLSLRTITEDIGQIRDEWHKGILTNLTAHINRELVLIDHVQLEAFDAWDKSKNEKTRSEAEKMDFAEQGRKAGTRSKLTRENQVGDPRHLAIILQCHQRRCRLLGLEPNTIGGTGDPERGGGQGPIPLPTAAPHILEIKILSQEEADAISAGA